MAKAMPRCSTCAVLIAWMMTAGAVLFAQTNSAPHPISNFPNLATIRADAAGGHALAQTKLGDYHLARGDMTNAVVWYRKAAEQGNTQAQLSLAACYLHGRGVEQDVQEALKWQHMASVKPSQRPGALLAQTSPALSPASVVNEPPPLPPVPTRAQMERIQSIPEVKPALDTAVALAPLPSPVSFAEPIFVRSQLPRISAISPGETELEDIPLKVRPAE